MLVFYEVNTSVVGTIIIIMELSKDTMEGLSNILNTSVIAEDNFLQVLDTAISHVCESSTETKCE